jgi:hypothetical protein
VKPQLPPEIIAVLRRNTLLDVLAVPSIRGVRHIAFALLGAAWRVTGRSAPSPAGGLILLPRPQQRHEPWGVMAPSADAPAVAGTPGT